MNDAVGDPVMEGKYQKINQENTIPSKMSKKKAIPPSEAITE